MLMGPRSCKSLSRIALRSLLIWLYIYMAYGYAGMLCKEDCMYRARVPDEDRSESGLADDAGIKKKRTTRILSAKK